MLLCELLFYQDQERRGSYSPLLFRGHRSQTVCAFAGAGHGDTLTGWWISNTHGTRPAGDHSPLSGRSAGTQAIVEAVPEVPTAGALQAHSNRQACCVRERYSAKHLPTVRRRNDRHPHFPEEETKARGGQGTKGHRPPVLLGSEHRVKLFLCVTVSLTPPSTVGGFPGTDNILH